MNPHIITVDKLFVEEYDSFSQQVVFTKDKHNAQIFKSYGDAESFCVKHLLYCEQNVNIIPTAI